MFVSLGCGLVVMLAYRFREKRTTSSFSCTLILLPLLAQVVILLVNRFGHIGMGVAVAGAFAMVRFRSIPGTAREITFVFFAMAVGIATGSGLLYFAPIITLIVIGIFLGTQTILSLTGGEQKEERELCINVPDELDYLKEFPPIFEKHGVKYEILSSRVKNMGSIYEIKYSIYYGAKTNEKAFIDDLRVVNRNMPIITVLAKVTRENGEL
jgi:uncharacterized membrane protein YhiD involved in acid resistance